MARRRWRSFDYLLLLALVLLSLYGVTMIYSATISTDWDHLPGRQLIFVGVGLVLLLITASIDYRLLDLVQQPLPFLTPLVLGGTAVGAVVTWRAGQLPIGEDAPPLSQFTPDVPAIALGLVLMFAVFVADRAWIEKLELPVTRFGAVVLVAGATAAGAFALSRLGGDRLAGLHPHLLVGGLAVAYLLDCLLLRITDILRNPLYVLMLGLLGIIFVVGQVSGGSQRWLGEGMVQPSELSKILLVVVLAKFLADHEEELERFGPVLVSLVVVAVPVLLIYFQPDLGTALILVAIWAAMMWVGRMRFRHILVLAGGGVAALPLVWFGMQDYMRERLLLFISPESNPDDYFNVHQALVSIGSGGWTGKGLTRGTQSQLHFLRVRHTDFIFAVTAEEIGFLGAVVMIGLLFLLLWRMLRVAGRARDTFGRLLVTGVAAIILFQSVVNVGMNLGLMPVTGIPLPFVSYGGSSYLTLMLGVGLVESVAMRHRKLEFD